MFFTIKKNKIIIYAVFVLIAFVSLLTLSKTGTYAVFFSKPIKKLPIYSVDTPEKKIAISFDCAWGTDYTDELLAVMERENVKCTFFTVEFWTEKHPDYIKKIFESGHEIGTHSATHPHMNSLSKENVIKELTTSSKAIEELTGEKVNLFRAPFGEYNDSVLSVAESLGLYTIQWSIDSLDWKDLSKTEIENRVIKRAQNGSIVLFHNQGENTAKALPTIIKTLKEQGFTFVKISELIYKDGYHIDINGKQIKN